MKFLILSFYFIIMLLPETMASSITMKVSQVPQYYFPSIKYIKLGNFQDITKKVILPFQEKQKTKKSVISNSKLADLVKSNLLAYLTSFSSWEVLPSQFFAGASQVKTDASKTLLISAKVAYYQEQVHDSEKGYFVLFVKNMSSQRNMLTSYAADLVGNLASQKKQGFAVTMPYTESLHAITVSFQFTRMSDHKKMIPEQKFILFYNHKWGGWLTSSILPKHMAIKLRSYYTFDLKYDLFSMILGRNLPQEETLPQLERIPKTNLEIEQRLSKRVAFLLAQKLVTVQRKKEVDIESGDTVATVLLQNEAYEEAAARIISLPTPLGRGNLYNLAVSYEARGDLKQALFYYQEGAKRFANEKIFKTAVQRLQHRAVH